NEGKTSDTTKKWLVGCGIGCGVIILILIALGISGYLFFKNIVDEFKDTEALMATLTERYGKITDFCPNPDGSISPDRVETFLAVREAFGPTREKLEISMKTLQDRIGQSEVEVKKPKNVFQMIRVGVGLIPQIGEFIKSRNQALLDSGMGMGEYYYIYAVAFYSWLEHLPEDGPDFQIIGPDDERGSWDQDEVLEERRDVSLRRLHRMLLPMLQNQLEKLSAADPSGTLDDWRTTLEAEIEAMEADRLRLPWQDGLPDVIESSLKSFRYQLERSYNKMTNPLELTFEQR
ncbi:MAG: hypothetical protein OEW23_08300, partial [Candidatus Aminicenantes bacterium]|nr:hypothetical protein [Candidatus Aminicenantes bacterium]